MRKKTLTYRHRIVSAMPYSLLHFLITYNCLKQYLDNYCKEPSPSFLKDLERGELIQIEKQGHVFTWAFSWKDTPEGFDYWHRRRSWYLEYLRTNKL